MKRFRSLAALPPLLLLAAGCGPQTNLPLVFAQTQSVGITVNGGATQQSAEITLGYRDFDVALIPTVITQPGGQAKELLADITQQGPTGCSSYRDGLSVLGQFQVDTTAKTSAAEISLGKFFATGQAAKRLSDGFAHKLEGTLSPGSPAAVAPPPFAAGCFMQS